MNKRTTIKDIANRLKIHHTTVSRALRDHPDIQPKTKKMVLAMADELNYHPNFLAQNLKAQRTNTIGVIVPEIKTHFFASVISGIEDIAYEAGYVILLSQSNEDFNREVLNTKTLISNHVAGLVVSISQTTQSSDHFKNFLERGGSLVFFDRVCEELNASKVTVDDYNGGFQATEHLIKKGYKKIAHLGGTRHLSIAKARYSGYRDALEMHHIKVNQDYAFFGGCHERNGKEGMDYLLNLSDPPDAVFAVNDPVALGAYQAIKNKGLTIPDDIAIVGFSNNPISAVVQPPLTTINQPAYEMGKKAAELLIEQINNSHHELEPKQEVLKTSLIIRQST
jgi:DNA-binding LacI/PurR family transcriptional regulator